MLRKAIEALTIEAVYLHSSTVRCMDGFVPQFMERDLSLVPQYRVGPADKFRVVTATREEDAIPSKTLLFYFMAGVRLIDTAAVKDQDPSQAIPEDAVYIEAKTEFCAQYALDAAIDPDELGPALEEFARFNVGYHVWPYWREYVQSLCGRMGIPPIPIPLYQLPRETSDSAVDPTEHHPTPPIDEILGRSQKRRFAEQYAVANPDAQAITAALVDRVRTEHPDVLIYPTDSTVSGDLRFEAGNRVACTLELKKRRPYLRLYLLKIPNAIPGPRIEFRKTGKNVLSTCVVIDSEKDLDDAMRYVDRAVANAKQD